ncbi:DUF1365 domain-containing protein [Roseicyclus mahoneyensis]|uniref:Cyclopropane-fatty-acyl-phospholipid synthase n=1 Tax=Roseicyclus mahoneyensis TaxID=164332 RepID=A0A316GGN3_9RHOB|nr:DUF1365 domain-containing protein [Roseicyclus mahoneyensis]PWK59748.1 hypothetical protein C7455_10634 [Roseicyclus mahoneyensis]
MSAVDHIAGSTFHGRRGAVENAFTYSIDYVMLDAEVARPRAPWLFGRNRTGLTALHDRDHGGPPKQGRGAPWAREVLAAHGLESFTGGKLMLLAQPRMLGHVFNPVSFWLAHDSKGLMRAVIAEVTNTFGDRHSYLCARDDRQPITREDVLSAQKLMHVSPFQPIAGGYTFRFDIRDDRVGIWIDYSTGNEGVLATLTGKRKPLTTGGVLRSAFRRPLGARRVLALIHWQALKLWWKGASYRARPEPPEREIS